MSDKYSITIIGSGNWATAIASNVGHNASSSDLFETIVYMYVEGEELEDGRKLCDVINTSHENEKFFPGFPIPENVVAESDLVESARNADILIFANKAHDIVPYCDILLGKVKPNAIAVSLVKGFDRSEEGEIVLISQIIMRTLKIPCSVLVGCNLTYEISSNNFCEGTLGCRDQKYNRILRDVFSSETFRVDVTDDVECVEICGAIRAILAFGAGCADGLSLNENTKAGIIRRGFIETIHFVDVFFPGSKMATFLNACGLSDLITSCYANKNRRLAEALVKTGKPLEELRVILGASHDVLGPFTAELVYNMLFNKGLEQQFPLFSAIFRICNGELPPLALVETLRYAEHDVYHPSHIFPL